MDLKKRIERFMKRLPIIGSLKLKLAEQTRLNKNSERFILNMMQARTKLKEENAKLESIVSDQSVENKTLKKSREFDKNQMIAFNRNIADKHAELRQTEQELTNAKRELEFMAEHATYRLDQHENHKAKYQELQRMYKDAQTKIKELEAKVEKAKKGFATFETFKGLTQKEYWALHKKHADLEEKHSALMLLFASNAKAFEEDHLALSKTERAKDRAKVKIASVLNIAKAYKHGPAGYVDTFLPKTVEELGLSVLLLDEQGTIFYSTPEAAKELHKRGDDLIGKNFNAVFDAASLDWLLDIGPTYPLGAKDAAEKVCAKIAEIPAGYIPGNKNMRTIYAISLERGDTPGRIERRRTERLAAPYAITQGYQQEVAVAMSSAAQRTNQAVYLDLSNTESVEPEFIDWLTKVNSSPNEGDGKIFACYPSPEIAQQLRQHNFSEDYIHKPKKKKPIKVPQNVFSGILALKPSPA
ncbi:hypothetical protein KY333_00590 [Candidatus Woesearchaeota archaeon]|nr:hypothetical protein [Candidatus Woesearchaeota archaeon]